MSDLTTLCNKISIKNAQSGTEFVGIRILNEEKFITFPMGYKILDKEIILDSLTMDQRKDILNFIAIINSCRKLKDGDRIFRFNNRKLSSDLPLSSMIYIIENYLDKEMYYTEKEILYTNGQSGKICWNRTIKDVNPSLSNKGIAYLGFVILKNRIQENLLITEIHKYCVYKCFELLGFLYTSFLPEKGQLTEIEISKNKKTFLTILQDKIDSTHLEQNLELFSALYEFIDNYSADGVMNTASYGTESFQTVWEDMVDKLFSTITQTQKEKYFYPHTKWSFKIRRQSPLRPDTIMIQNGMCFILDSKYYSYSALETEDDENREESVNGSIPGSDSIQKQITYAEFIDNSIDNNNLYVRSNKFRFQPDKIFNVFIIPANNGSKLFDYKGYAISEWKDNSKNYHYVHVVTLDTNYLMRNYQKKGDEMRKLLVKVVTEESKNIY